MAFNVNDLHSQLTRSLGVARPNRYSVRIDTNNIDTSASGSGPDLLTGGLSNLASKGLGKILSSLGIQDVEKARRLSLFCDRAELPSKTFATSESRHYGPTFKTPYQGIYAPLRLQFLVGGDMWEKYFFDGWQYAVEDPVTNDFSYQSDYTTTIVISQLEETGGLQGSFQSLTKIGSKLSIPGIGGLNDLISDTGITYQAILVEAWPISVDNLILDYSETNTPHRLTVTFGYKSWYTGGMDISDSVRSIGDTGIGPLGNFTKNIGI